MFLCVLGVRARKGERERGGLFMSLRESAGSEHVRACESARVCVTEREDVKVRSPTCILKWFCIHPVRAFLQCRLFSKTPTLTRADFLSVSH